MDDSTGGVPGGTKGGGLEVDEKLLELASDEESGSDNPFKKDSSSKGEEEGEGERERSKVEDGGDRTHCAGESEEGQCMISVECM